MPNRHPLPLRPTTSHLALIGFAAGVVPMMRAPACIRQYPSPSAMWIRRTRELLPSGSTTRRFTMTPQVLEARRHPDRHHGKPDHWHTLVNIHALRPRQGIYAKSRLTLTIDEGKHLVESEEIRPHPANRHAAAQRSAFRQLRAGAQRPRRQAPGSAGDPSGRRREGAVFAAARCGRLRLNFWQGQTPDVPYEEGAHAPDLPLLVGYSGGTMTDGARHHKDIALWGTGLDSSGPVSVDGKSQVQMIPGGSPPPANTPSNMFFANASASARSPRPPTNGWARPSTGATVPTTCITV